jgi:hypothetical protein
MTHDAIYSFYSLSSHISPRLLCLNSLPKRIDEVASSSSQCRNRSKLAKPVSIVNVNPVNVYCVSIHVNEPMRKGKKPYRTVSAAARRNSRRLYLLLHHRLVPPPPAGLTGVRRCGEPILCVEVLVKVVFSSRLS